MTPNENTTRHTPEPWCFYMSPVGLPCSDWSIYRDLDTDTNGPDGAQHLAEVFGQHFSVNNRNAARIVACVNACTGMADPAAEIAKLKGFQDFALSAAKQEADELAHLRAKVQSSASKEAVNTVCTQFREQAVMLAALRAQRDELWEALVECERQFSHLECDGDRGVAFGYALDGVRAALARCEKGGK